MHGWGLGNVASLSLNGANKEHGWHSRGDSYLISDYTDLYVTLPT